MRQIEPLKRENYSQLVEDLRGWGLPVAEHFSVAKDIDEAIRGIEAFEHVRGKLGVRSKADLVRVAALRIAFSVLSTDDRQSLDT